MDGFILGHACMKCIPIFRFLLNMVDTFRDICQGAVDVKDDGFFGHR